MAKLFQIFVPDNTLVSRVISCENQVTELFVIDRRDRKFVTENSSELNKPALYILVNRDKKQLYVGETDDSIKRLRNHEAKDFWTEAIVFHSTGDTLSTTEVKWLEAKTYETLSKLGYYDLSENKQNPQYPPLKKNQIYTLEPIFEEAKNYICAAGFDFFLRKGDDQETSINAVDSSTNSSSNVWLICYDSKYFDVAGCFNKYGHIYWRHRAGINSVQKGDIIYLYGSSPESAIRYKAEVIDSQLPYSKDMDAEDDFVKSGNTNSDSPKSKYFLVKLIAETYSLALKHTAMMNAGVMGKRPTATKISKKEFNTLRQYIEQHFDDIDIPAAPPMVGNTEPTIIVETKSKRKAPAPPFKFSMIGLKPGDKVVFDALKLEVIVASENTIKYNNKEYKLTTFCKEFLPKSKRTKANTYQGADFFSFQGKKLAKIRKEKKL